MTDRIRASRPGGPGAVVIKLGGSVLTGGKSYARAARWLEQTCGDDGPLGFGAPLLVVVSAEHGVTDRLLTEAESICAAPDSRSLDLLWSTGELRSAALLALHLQARGIASRALNVHETGLRPSHETGLRASHETGLRPGLHRAPAGIHLRRALDTHAVVVVPGFLATDADDAIVSLGRGGSDLTAVTLAASVGASRCELIKDVPGYFTADPAADAAARHIPTMTVGEALAMAREGCELVQEAALEAARAHGVRLVIRTNGADTRRTIVLTDTEGDRDAIRYEDDSRRAAVGA